MLCSSLSSDEGYQRNPPVTNVTHSACDPTEILLLVEAAENRGRVSSVCSDSRIAGRL